MRDWESGDRVYWTLDPSFVGTVATFDIRYSLPVCVRWDSGVTQWLSSSELEWYTRPRETQHV